MKKTLLLMMTAAAAITFAGCKDDGKTAASVLNTDKPAIDAAYTAGAYAIAVTGNVAWTATVNSGAATWCTLADASGNGDGTVTVNVTENTTARQTRAATVTVAGGDLTKTVDITQQKPPYNVFTTDNPPAHAASSNAWSFGNSTSTWSDAIQIPECSNPDFSNSPSEPRCRSYTENGKTWYYYNWAYVDAHADALCPSPWRVPSQSDLNTLVAHADYSAVISAWGSGGRAYESEIRNGSGAYYWSSTEHATNTSGAYFLSGLYDLKVEAGTKYNGLQLRCVK
jgi:hypothetical protein